MERKHLSRPFELKAVNDNGTFEGYGSVFGVEDWYRDIVAPGAFAKTLAAWKLKGTMPSLCWQHDMERVIGVYEEMREDEYGLYLKGRLLKDDIELAREAYALLKNRAVSGLSIGYRVLVDEYNRDTDVRTLKELELWEVSLVTMPANDLARVESVKNVKTVVDLERYLRQAEGISRAEARQVIHDVKSSMRQACDRSELAQLIEKNIATLRG
jgi:hypothetical protein